MKLLTFISFLIIPSLLNAQFVQGDLVRKQNSARNLQFTFDNAGEMVGQGMCFEFVYEAVKLSHPKDYKIVLSNIEKFRIKDSTKVISGDVVLFKNIVYNSYVNDTIIGHIGIVLDNLMPDGFTFAGQNHGEKNGEKRKVVYRGNTYNAYIDSEVKEQYFDYESMKSGTITFYRF